MGKALCTGREAACDGGLDHLADEILESQRDLVLAMELARQGTLVVNLECTARAPKGLAQSTRQRGWHGTTYSFVTNSVGSKRIVSVWRPLWSHAYPPSVVSFSKGVLPTTTSYMVTPRDQMSASRSSCNL